MVVEIFQTEQRDSTLVADHEFCSFTLPVDISFGCTIVDVVVEKPHLWLGSGCGDLDFPAFCLCSGLPLLRWVCQLENFVQNVVHAVENGVEKMFQQL